MGKIFKLLVVLIVGVSFLILLMSCWNGDSVKQPMNFEFQECDIIFQTSTSLQSKAVQLATRSKYSHMGIIFIKKDSIFVLEAIQPVKYTPVDEWIRRGENKHYWVKRLRNSDSILTSEVKQKMHKIGAQFLGKDYDLYFEWSDKRIYCSELVWKIYKQAADIEIGKLEKLEDFDLTSNIVKQKLKERYGNNIPLEEQVISPASIFGSDNLITVIEK